MRGRSEDPPGRRGVHSAGGGASVEAPPWRPGHVGHTPQELVSALITARLEGIFSSETAMTVPVEFAMHNFGHPQRFERPGHIATLLSLEDFARRSALPFTPRGPMAFRDSLVGVAPPKREA